MNRDQIGRYDPIDEFFDVNSGICTDTKINFNVSNCVLFNELDEAYICRVIFRYTF